MIVEFGLDLVTRSALAVAFLFRWIFRIWVAALDHESFDDAVKNSPVVKSGARELLEVLNRIRRGVGPKLHDHFAFARFNHCDLI